MTAVDLVATVTPRFPQVTVRASSDCPAFNVPADGLLEFLQYLRDEAGYVLLSDVSGIDWGVDQVPRFSVAYHVFSLSKYELRAGRHTLFRQRTPARALRRAALAGRGLA